METATLTQPNTNETQTDGVAQDVQQSKKERVVKPIDPNLPINFRVYRRDKKTRVKTGLLVGQLEINYNAPTVLPAGYLTIGWSLVHRSSGDPDSGFQVVPDKFSKARANEIAAGRLASRKYVITIGRDNIRGEDLKGPFRHARTCVGLNNFKLQNWMDSDEIEVDKRTGIVELPLAYAMPFTMHAMIDRLVEKAVYVINRKVQRYNQELVAPLPH